MSGHCRCLQACSSARRRHLFWSAWVWITTCLASARAATNDFVNSDVSGGRWTPISLATLVYAVVNSRIDYCNTVLTGAPRSVTDKLQRVLNAAARVVTGTWKLDGCVGQILHDELHWLDVPDRVFFKMAVTVHAPVSERLRTAVYLSDYCVLAAGADTRSANRQLLAVPRCRLNTYGRRAFSVASPTRLSLKLCPGFHPGPDHQCRLFQTFA